jgi:hypothetical protein
MYSPGVVKVAATSPHLARRHGTATEAGRVRRFLCNKAGADHGGAAWRAETLLPSDESARN